jgi:phospholipid/cholesterol/gamma-HCH transport system substrate-binding protein
MRRAVGIFFFLGLAALAGLSLWVDDEMSFFRKGGSYYYVDLPGAEGLQDGAAVWLAGLQTGRITGIEMREDGVRVHFLLKGGHRLRQDSVVSLPATSMLANGRNLALTLGSPGSPFLATKTSMPGTPVVNVRPVTSLDTLLAKADELFGSLKEAGPAIREAAESVRSIAKKIETGEGTLGKLIGDPKLYNDLVGAVAKLDEGLAGFRSIAGKVERGEGTIGKLVNDDALYKDLSEASRGIAELARKVNAGEGTLGRLVSDPALYEELKGAASSLAAVMQKVDRGEGTLGKLVNDEALYAEATRMFREVREAVEDAREQAPITAFASVMFAAFQ